MTADDQNPKRFFRPGEPVPAEMKEKQYVSYHVIGGETYFGHQQEFADYYDYHFYCDLNYFQPTVLSFLPHWRPRLPWLFGEYCDSDTFRDLPAIVEANGGDPPWWSVEDEAINPQGVRWEYAVTHHLSRLEAAELMERREELNHGSRQQALLIRKQIIEWTRSYREMGGYVITGLRDTPISTAGVFDDFNEPKWPPEAFRAFNQDSVLFAGWGRRREWRNGGDRPSHIDPYNYWSGETVRAHIGISHYGVASVPPVTRWSLSGSDGTVWYSGVLGRAPIHVTPSQPGGTGTTPDPLQDVINLEEANSGEDVLSRPLGGLISPPFTEDTARDDAAETTPVLPLEPGEVRELDVVEFVAPEALAPTKALLRAEAWMGDYPTANEWPLWFYPAGAFEGLPGPIALYDPMETFERAERHGLNTVPFDPRRFSDMQQNAGSSSDEAASETVPQPPLLIATSWTPEVLDYVRSGGRAVLVVLDAQNPIPTLGCPFWREAIKLFEPHPLWARFPHEGFTDLQFYGLAADRALVTQEILPFLGADATGRSVLRRVDARSLEVSDYLVDVTLGQGRAFITTLRIPGGNGDQASGLYRHTGGAYFLACLLHELAQD